MNITKLESVTTPFKNTKRSILTNKNINTPSFIQDTNLNNLPNNILNKNFINFTGTFCGAKNIQAMDATKMTEEEYTSQDFTGWIKFPKRACIDPDDNFQALETLLAYNSFLNQDFVTGTGETHVYMVKGKPQLKIALDWEGKIGSIASAYEDEIPPKYYDTITEYINSNGFGYGDYYTNNTYDIKMENCKARKDKVDELLANTFPNKTLETLSPSQILTLFGIEYEQDDDGNLVLEDYRVPSIDNNTTAYTFDKIGIDENKLFEKIKEIKSTANLRYCRATNFGILEHVGTIYADANQPNIEAIKAIPATNKIIN